MEKEIKGQPPVKTVDMGNGVKVSLWVKTDEYGKRYKFTVKQNYTQDEGKTWKSTSNIPLKKALEVAKALETLYTEFQQKEK